MKTLSASEYEAGHGGMCGTDGSGVTRRLAEPLAADRELGCQTFEPGEAEFLGGGERLSDQLVGSFGVAGTATLGEGPSSFEPAGGHEGRGTDALAQGDRCGEVLV